MSRSLQMSRRRFLEVGGLAGVLASLAACGGESGGGAEAGGEAAAGGTLTLAIADEPTGMDIQQIEWENAAHQLIYEPLITYSPDLTEVNPAFAESFEASEDGLTFTFRIPADAKFSNGDPCDAAAVKASFERYVETSPFASDYDDVESFEAVDDTTFVMHFASPSPYSFAPIVSSYGGIVNAAAAAEMDANEFSLAPIANGAYYVDSWEHGSQMTLKRNEYFHTNNPELTNQEAPAFDTIVIRFISDSFTRVTEVEDGDADLIFNVPATSLADLKDNAEVTVFEYMQPGTNYISMNPDSGLLVDEALRQAITYAINRDEITDALDGVVTPLFGYISPAMSCYSQEEEDRLSRMLAFDLDYAKQVLANGGWEDTDGDGIVEKDGVPASFELLVPLDHPSASASAPVLQQQLAAAGIDAQIREFEAAYIQTLEESGDYTAAWDVFEWVDADILYSVLTPVGGLPWDDPEVTKALEVARVIVDAEERTAAYVTAQELMATKYKDVALFYDHYACASKKALEGVIVTNDGRFWLNDAVKA